MSKQRSAGAVFMVGLFVGAMLINVLAAIGSYNDYDINTIGKVMCHQDGREFVKIDYDLQSRLRNGAPNEQFIKVYCTPKLNESIKAIYDNALFEVK